MPFTDTIVKFINDSLRNGSLKDGKLQAGIFFGLSSIVARKNESGSLGLWPAIANNNGEYKPVQPDDKFPFMIYHKPVSTAYSYAKNDSYGDKYNIKAATENIIVAWIDSKKTNISAQFFETMIIAGLPLQVTSELKSEMGIISSLITPLSSNMDVLNVFRSEYQNVDFFLKPYHGFFSIRYRIETTFNQACLSACKC